MEEAEKVLSRLLMRLKKGQAADVAVQIDGSGLNNPGLGAGSPESAARTEPVTEHTEANSHLTTPRRCTPI